MTCREVLDFLMAYLDGDLPEDARTVFEEHLAECVHCQSYLHNYRETVRMSQSAYSVPADADLPAVPEELVRAILNARAKES